MSSVDFTDSWTANTSYPRRAAYRNKYYVFTHKTGMVIKHYYSLVPLRYSFADAHNIIYIILFISYSSLYFYYSFVCMIFITHANLHASSLIRVLFNNK